MSDTHTPPDFDNRVLVGVKGVNNPETRIFMQAWRRTEGGTAKWNPLNCSLWVQNFTSTTNYNDVPVRNYLYENVGVAATILMLSIHESDGTLRYGGIVNDLQHGMKTAEQMVKDNASQIHRWGTDTDLMLKVIADIRAGR